jgi:hypothetical protein
MAQTLNQTIHIRFAGRSEELSTQTLNLSSGANDSEIKQAIIRHFDLPFSSLNDHVIVRTNHAIIVRPEAIYG